VTIASVGVQTIGSLSLKDVLMTSGTPVRAKKQDMIPFTHHVERTIYGKDVMDLTIFGLRSM
jgi:hypothetical protein